jgi:Lrp/AsnC family transcriptional regulator for asnA, asnC and gidA
VVAERREMDDLDRKIILALQQDGRASYKTIAKKLRVSDGTIRFRIGRMVRKNILRITASINPFAVENGLLALVGMQLERRTHKQTMEKISRLKGVVSVSNATGRYDLLVEVFLDSQKELNRFLMEDLSGIGGINATETYIYLHAINKWVELS